MPVMVRVLLSSEWMLPRFKGGTFRLGGTSAPPQRQSHTGDKSRATDLSLPAGFTPHINGAGVRVCVWVCARARLWFQENSPLSSSLRAQSEQCTGAQRSSVLEKLEGTTAAGAQRSSCRRRSLQNPAWGEAFLKPTCRLSRKGNTLLFTGWTELLRKGMDLSRW